MKKSHQAQIERVHIDRGSWEPASSGYGLNGDGQGAGGRPKPNEYMAEQENKCRNFILSKQRLFPTLNEKRDRLKKERLDHAKQMYINYSAKLSTQKEADYFKTLIITLESEVE